MRSNPNIIGRLCIVKDTKIEPPVLVSALVIDTVAGENRSKRVRLQSGEHFGEVRTLGQYELVEFIEHNEMAGCLAAAWAE